MESEFTVAADRENTAVMKPGCRQDGESNNTWLQLPKDPQKARERETPESPEGDVECGGQAPSPTSTGRKRPPAHCGWL